MPADDTLFGEHKDLATRRPATAIDKKGIICADRLYGDWANVTLNAELGGGIDRLFGQTDDDILVGEAGDDLLFGEHGNDTLRDAEGTNILERWHGNGPRRAPQWRERVRRLRLERVAERGQHAVQV